MMRFPPSVLLTISLAALVACGNGTPDFEVVPAKTEVSVTPGGTVSVPVAINRVGGFNEAVRVSLAAPPAGVSAQSVTIGGGDSSGVLLIRALPQAVEGSKSVTIRTVSAGSTIKVATVNLSVGAEPKLECALEVPKLKLAQFTTVPVKVRLNRQNYKGAVVVAFGNLPAGFRASDALVAGDENEATLPLTATGRVAATAQPMSLEVQVTTGAFGTEALKLEVEVTPGSGSLDPGFGADGKVVTAVSGGADAANAVTVQPDGKVVVAGASGGQFAVLRYGRDGGPDVGFGAGGLASSTFSANAEALAVAVTPDAKIVAAGRAGSGQFALARYRSNGTPDEGFGVGGQVTGALAPGEDNMYFAVAAQPDGKIVAAGMSKGRSVLARYLVDGSLDLGFGLNGYAVLDIVGDGERAYAVALQQDGKILIAGRAASSVGLFVARYNADGLLDSDFGDGGASTRAIGTTMTAARGLALQPDGKIVLAGYADFAGTGSDTLLARVLPNGRFDAGFGAGGFARTDVRPGKHDFAYAVALQADGKIVAVGNASNAAGGLDMAALRFLPDGKPDESFAGSGVSTTRAGLDGVRANAMALQPGGILVAGNAGTSADTDMALVRFLP